MRERWYRIPAAFAPRRKFSYLAFYQPAVFGRHGKRIERYARVVSRKAVMRIDILPQEPDHPRSYNTYIKFCFAKIKKLSRPVKNVIPRRITFGFTTLARLISAKDILALYGVPPTEQMVEKGLKSVGINATPQYSVTCGRRRYRIDLAIVCVQGIIAIECDNKKAHTGRMQRIRDLIKDADLNRLGWRVLRFGERDIIERLDRCIERIQKAIRFLGGRIT